MFQFFRRFVSNADSDSSLRTKRFLMNVSLSAPASAFVIFLSRSVRERLSVANYAVLSASTIHYSPPIMGAIKLRTVYLVNYCSKWKFNLI